MVALSATAGSVGEAHGGLTDAFEPVSSVGPVIAHPALLVMVLNHLIPQDGGMPAAGDLGVAHFIEEAASVAPDLDVSIRKVLGALPDADTFTRLSEAEADRLLQQVENADAHSFGLMVQATYAGYYGHPEVLKVLGWVDPLDAGLHDAALLERNVGPQTSTGAGSRIAGQV